MALLAACGCEGSKHASQPASPRAELEPEATSRRSWTFDDLQPGSIPAGVRLAETGAVGTPATWAVVEDPSAPSRPHAFGVVASANDKKTYNLALLEGVRDGDVDLQVSLRAVSGQLNQGGGLVWRAKGADDYYLARWDPLEDNVYIYVVQGGARTALAKADLELDHDAWHVLRVIARSSQIELFIDDTPVLSVEDSTFPLPGMVGLWTKSDAATRFDDLSVAEP